MNRKFFVSTIVITGLLLGGVAISQNIKLNPIKPGIKPSASVSDEQQAILAVRKAKASVVSIVGFETRTVSAGAGESMAIQPSLEPLYGTGLIYSKDGLIVSNSHVVQETTAEYFVILPDGSERPAKVLGLDTYTDVALLKIEATDLVPAVLGSSQDLETGQTVFAIGNSLGRYQNTVTRGVISGLGRSVNVSTPDNPKPRFLNLIQTDAAINPGNSGGPLVNLAGEVIGLNTVVDRSGEGVGFAVPIAQVLDSVNQLLAFGKASHPYVGLAFTTIDRLVKAVEGLTLDEGALILSVVPGGPAHGAGLRARDIILTINGIQLTQKNELDDVLRQFRAGDTVLFTFLREGVQMQTPVLLGEFK